MTDDATKKKRELEHELTLTMTAQVSNMLKWFSMCTCVVINSLKICRICNNPILSFYPGRQKSILCYI